MSNTVITNYTDLNGPSTKADSSVVVIVNKDGSLSVDQKLLGTLMGTDGSQGAGISVVRVGHEGKPDDATDSETDDDKVPHVTLSVDSYYNEPNSIIKYDSGAEMLQSLKIETRENSLVGFQNDHCYTPLTSPSQVVPQRSDTLSGFDDPVIEITHTPPPKPISNTKKITILEQQIIPKGKKIVLSASDSPVVLKGNDILNKRLLSKSKRTSEVGKKFTKNEETNESSSISSSGDSIPDRDSDSDYKDTKDRTDSLKTRRSKLKPRILKNVRSAKTIKGDLKTPPKLKLSKAIAKREIKEKTQHKNVNTEKKQALGAVTSKEIIPATSPDIELTKVAANKTLKQFKKEKKTSAHVTALLTDMTSLFSTPDVIRRVSTDNKVSSKSEKEQQGNKKTNEVTKTLESNNDILMDSTKVLDNLDKPKNVGSIKTYIKPKDKNPGDKITKGYDIMPQLDDASLAQILQDTTSVTSILSKNQSGISTANTLNSPGLAGTLSPTLDLLGGLQPEEEGLTEDLLMHVSQLMESSENLQEVIDKQVLGKVDSLTVKSSAQMPYQQPHATGAIYDTPKSLKTVTPRKDPIEIIRRDGRVITLPPIEAPATRASKRKNQVDSTGAVEPVVTPTSSVGHTMTTTPEMQIPQVSKQYINKKLSNKKAEKVNESLALDKLFAESQESWNSEDDPNRLWCICKQPHNNRFMICCDGCEDWFHGKCVNITKSMGQQMEEQGIEWRCPNCIKKVKPSPKSDKPLVTAKKQEVEEKVSPVQTPMPKTKNAPLKTNCIVCKKLARASSIYCSDTCILKHAQDSLGSPNSSNKQEEELGKVHDKHKSESRVIVYERKSGRLLAGPNAPTAENLKLWLQKNPTFEVVRPGTLSTIKPNTSGKKLTEPNKIQTTLNFERIPKKIPVPEQVSPVKSEPSEIKEVIKPLIQLKETKSNSQPKTKASTDPQPKTPVTPNSQQKTSVASNPPKTPTTINAHQKSIQTPESQPKSSINNHLQSKTVASLLQKSSNQSKSAVISQPKTSVTPNSEQVSSGTPKVQTKLSLILKPQAKTPLISSSPSKSPGTPSSQTKTFVNSNAQPKTPTNTKPQAPQTPDTTKATTAASKTTNEPRRLSRATASRSLSEKASVSPATSRRKDTPDSKNKMCSSDGSDVRENVRKALQEQITIRMAENTENMPKFSEDDIEQFADDIEYELHELFKDVGMKYKAKYRSLMFNIKDRKNLSLWQKICERKISAKQLVRLSPEELASQELAEWRDKEAKYQLELIKKSEIDLLAASKTYVLKTHKGEEVMETKTSVSTELDPNVAVEDLVTVLNDATGVEEPESKSTSETPTTTTKSNGLDKKSDTSYKKDKDEPEDKKSKSRRESKHETESKKSRSSKKIKGKDREERSTRRSDRKSTRTRSASKDRSKEKPDSTERTRRRSRSRAKSRRRSKSHERSRSVSRTRERSKSQSRPKRRSRSKETMKLRRRSRSKHSTEEKGKHRSRSQENVSTKGKNESTDSDSIERPKSAMLKEVHPEYDPHEPMITSAFSEEDLRKSREDVYVDSYKTDISGFGDAESEFDTSKEFSIDTNILPTLKYPDKPDKIWEVESDQEPSSTVDNSAPVVWNGCINMVDVARFYVAAHEVSGTAGDLEEDLSTELDIVGRINPDTVWDYIQKMKKAGNKDIIILKLQAANDEEMMQYIALYSYLSTRNRLGVVQVSNTTTLKDFYIVPLPANTSLPPILESFNGHGLGEVKTHLLIGIVIRQRRKRIAPHIPKDIIPSKMGRVPGSYTPPMVAGSYTPPMAASSYTPPSSPRSRPLVTSAYTSPALSSSVKDKIAASLAAADDEEAYSPGSCSSGGSAARASTPGPATALRTKMDELNRQIEEQKMQILKMARADSSVADEEAYSPSRPMTPPSSRLADIALPSNLQEILATIKQREIAPEPDP